MTELKTKQEYLNKINELKKELRLKPQPEISSNSLNKVKEQGYKEGQKEAEIRFNKEIYK